MPDSHLGLVRHLQAEGLLDDPALLRAFEAVDRAGFVPEAAQPWAYADAPLEIGHGQTISQPTTVAILLGDLGPRPGDRVLDVGSGSGWTTALLAALVGPDGVVVGRERVPDLVAFGRSNLARIGAVRAAIGPAGPTLGAPELAPFDRILVSAEAHDVPAALIAQLAPGGVLVVPVRDAIVRVEKAPDGQLRMSARDGFVFVPLIEDPTSG